MAVIVIGGQSRSIGKTSIACALISATPEIRWTAIKITSHRHLTTPASGRLVPGGQNYPPFTITEERDPTTSTDTSRYLAAGAVRALLIQANPDQLSQAMPNIQSEIALSQHVLIESNSILDHLQPDLYAIVVNQEIADFKDSARRNLGRADALLEVEWGHKSKIFNENNSLRDIPVFKLGPPEWLSTDLAIFITQKLHKSRK